MTDIIQLTDTSGGRVHNSVAKLDHSGNLPWGVQQETATRDNPPQDVRGMGVVVDATGNLYLGGYVDGNDPGNTLPGAPDTFLSKSVSSL
ncbi:hypothetical protein SAMN05443572_105124 [Myxococcus fulvus]|uniref:Uncharacterized protein n=1 Tax=Myxococcus fulvus TaxID=33 RepID=A0A511TD22_MYXFU|nr:hypothetical protein [Myxococcus fulvus]GEN11513.1 hypothetical protein MFU01_65500 [Myxococcus fulvus]SEU12509.1 hypothetical protein SAMN05443572_105124 [Myxococcus fulvus]